VTPVLTSSQRIPALDGLRGIAIALVIVYHTLFRLPAEDGGVLATLLASARLGWTGVDLFFVLSGFLIGGILLDAVGSPNYYKTFYLRRAYRILPVYLVLVGLFGLRFAVQSVGPLGKLTESQLPLLSYLTFTQNIWMALTGTLGVGTMAMTWSLAIEEQFYLTVPYLIRRIARSRLPILLLGVVIGAPVLRALLLLAPERGHFAAFVLMPCRADALCMGVLCALIARTPGWWDRLLARRATLRGVTGILLLGMIVLTVSGSAPMSTLMVTIGYSWIALFYASCLLLAITASDGPLYRVLTNPRLMSLGTVAYFTYLAHLPITEACKRAVVLRFPASSPLVHLAAYTIGVALTLVLAKLSWRFFEQPMLRRGHVYRY
jgi:peptidoglycan/LPS O-acetylase OafA/YrhL